MPTPRRNTPQTRRPHHEAPRAWRVVLREDGLGGLWREQPRIVVRGTLIALVALLVLVVLFKLVSASDPESRAEATQAKFVAQAAPLCQSALGARQAISDTPAIAAELPPEAASESSSVRLQLLSDLGGLTPRAGQAGNLARLRDGLSRRSQIEKEIVDVRELTDGPSVTQRKALEAERTSVSNTVATLAKTLGIPTCGEV